MCFYQKIIISFLLIVNSIQAQQYPVKNISTQDGLINNSIQSVYKDSRGTLWVGTMIGLSKIQNNKIQNLTIDDGLAHSSCWAIIEDTNHNMWFGSYGGGITFFNGKKFIVYNKKNGLVNNFIRKLFVYKDKLFVGTDAGFSIIDINSKKIESYKSFNGKTDVQVMCFFEHKNIFYIGTFKDGLWRLNKEKHFELINAEKSISSLFKAKDSIKFYSNFYLNNLSIDDFLSNQEKDKLKIKSIVIWDFAETNDKQTYVAIQDFVNPCGGVFKILKTKLQDYNQYFNIYSKQVWCLFYDKKSNQLYVGTSDKGLYIVDLSKEVDYYNLFNEDIKSILKTTSSQIFITSNSIYFKNNNEINKIKNSSLRHYIDQFYHKHPGDNLKANYKDFQIKNHIEITIYGSEVYKDNLFISTSLGFFKISKEGKILTFSPIYINHFKMFSSTELIASRDYQSVIYYKDFRQHTKGESLDLKNDDNPRDVLSITYINKSLYLSSYSKGLFKYENNKSHSFFARKEWGEKELITSSKNDKGQLLVATQRGNIYIVQNSNKFKIVKKIYNKEIQGLTINFLEFYKGYIIIGTNLGLNLYKEGKNIFLDEKNGLENKIFNSCFLDNGILNIATTKGYYKVNLEKIIQQNNSKPILKISKLEVNYKLVLKDHFSWNCLTKNSIELPYDKNTISLEFEPKNVSEKSKLLYRFKIEGLKNNKWGKWSNANSILLPFLPDGKFKIDIQTNDLNTGTFYTQKILTILIHPPFYKKFEFIFFIVFILALLIYGYVKNRIKKITQKNEIQKRLIETKMEALQSQMNPHFTFNAMNSIQNYILKNKTEDALQYLVDFSRLIRQTLDNSLKSSITLEEELSFITLYVNLQNKRYTSPVVFNIVTSDTIDKSKVTIPPMIIQPFIENSFIHAFSYDVINPKLELEIVVKDNSITITIEDNGCGFDVASIQEHSKGINLVKERIKLYNSDTTNSFEIYSKPHNGTKITITLFSSLL
jgi:ligand-binding sensor domain-containing protein